jgi:5-methylcytosine-specific restriction endonuclease McrA
VAARNPPCMYGRADHYFDEGGTLCYYCGWVPPADVKPPKRKMVVVPGARFDPNVPIGATKGYRKRTALALMYGWSCQYCGVKLSHKSATRDHVVPIAEGGWNGLDNEVLSCKPCNGAKGSSSAEEFRQSDWLRDRIMAVNQQGG